VLIPARKKALYNWLELKKSVVSVAAGGVLLTPNEKKSNATKFPPNTVQELSVQAQLTRVVSLAVSEGAKILTIAPG
jgi:hypothetical protein